MEDTNTEGTIEPNSAVSNGDALSRPDLNFNDASMDDEPSKVEPEMGRLPVEFIRDQKQGVSFSAMTLAATYAAGTNPAVVARTLGVSLLIVGIIGVIEYLVDNTTASTDSANSRTVTENPGKKSGNGSGTIWGAVVAFLSAIASFIGALWDFFTSGFGLVTAALAAAARFLLPLIKDEEEKDTRTDTTTQSKTVEYADESLNNVDSLISGQFKWTAWSYTG